MCYELVRKHVMAASGCHRDLTDLALDFAETRLRRLQALHRPVDDVDLHSEARRKPRTGEHEWRIG